MYLRYGSYTHAQNEASVVIDTAVMYTPRAEIEMIRYTFAIKGVIHGTSQNNLLANIAALENAYKFANGYDLVLLEDDLVTVFSQLPSGTSLGGTRVKNGPSYPVGDGAEGSTFRTYTITLEADYVNVNNNILSWQDNLQLTGGGPRYVFLGVLSGAPQQQIAQQQTTYKATQSGQSVGMFGYAGAAPPVFPQAILPEQTSITLTSPLRVGNNFRDWVTAWSYSFESTTPLDGFPVSL